MDEGAFRTFASVEPTLKLASQIVLLASIGQQRCQGTELVIAIPILSTFQVPALLCFLSSMHFTTSPFID